jgi:hypothetical protein
MNIA